MIGGESGARLLVASGADRAYFPLLRDTVLSIRANRQNAAIGVLDLGLDREHREWLSARVTHIVRPGWDLEFPHRARVPETSLIASPIRRSPTSTARTRMIESL